MEFTELYTIDAPKLCKWSPDGRFIALVTKHTRLLIRDGTTLQILRIFSCIGEVQECIWSPDSKLVLCGIVHVWSLENPDWICKIEDGSAGISAARWCPNSRQIATIADFQTRMTIWSLSTKATVQLRPPKSSVQGFTFSSNGSFAVVAERRDCKDFLTVYSTENWATVTHFPVSTVDLSDVCWSPDDCSLCLHDCATEYFVALHSPLDGRCLQQYSAYQNGLGVKCVRYSPSGQLIAVGSFDEKVRILHAQSFRLLAEFSHKSPATGPAVAVYREVAGASSAETAYVAESSPTNVPAVKPPVDKPNPKLGVGWLEWSRDGKYLASRNDNMASAVWIWDVNQLALCSILLHNNSVKMCEWDTRQARLAIACGSEMLYLWTPSKAACALVSPGFAVRSLKWRGDGSALMLMDDDKLCGCYFEAEDK